MIYRKERQIEQSIFDSFYRRIICFFLLRCGLVLPSRQCQVSTQKNEWMMNHCLCVLLLTRWEQPHDCNSERRGKPTSLHYFTIFCINIHDMGTEHKYDSCCRDVGLPHLTQRQVSAVIILGHGLMFQGCGASPWLQRWETGQAYVSTLLIIHCTLYIINYLDKFPSVFREFKNEFPFVRNSGNMRKFAVAWQSAT